MHHVRAPEHCPLRLFLHLFSTICKLELHNSKVCAFLLLLENLKKKKKRDCNDSTVWATSRWQQSLRHLTMRLLKTLQKKKKDLHSRETHCILIDSFCFVLVLFCFFILLLVNRCCGLFTFQMCCLWIALMVYIYANSCVFWSLFFVTIFFHVWIKLLFITQTCWTFFFFF